MTRITVEVDDELLAAARTLLGTKTKVATIHAALQQVARRKQVAEALALMNSVKMDYSGSENAFRYGGGRDLGRLDEAARPAAEASLRESA